MAAIETWYSQELTEPVQVKYLDGNVFSQDNYGNKIGVVVTKNGFPFALTGTVSGSVIRADGKTVAVSGYASENSAYIILPAAAYYVPGIISIVIKLTTDNVITTLCAVVANVYQSATDATVDPGTIIPSISNLINAIQEAVSSIPLDYSALSALATATAQDVLKVENQFYNGDNLLAGKEFTYLATQDSNNVLFTRLGLAYYKIYGTANGATSLNYFNSLTSLPERIKAGNSYYIHVEGYPVRIAYSKNGTSFNFIYDYEEGTHVFTVPSDAVGMTVRLYVPDRTSVDAVSRAVVEDVSVLSNDYAITTNKSDIDRLTGLYAPYMVLGGYNFVDGEDVPRSSSYMADRRAIVPIGSPVKLEVGDKIIVDDPVLYYYYATYDYDNDEWNKFNEWHQGGEVADITIAGDYYIVIRKGLNLEISSINELTYKFAIVRNSQAGFLYHEIEEAKQLGSVQSALDSLPSYYHENNWIENKIQAVRDESEIVNGVTFSFFTDVHFNANAKNSKYLIKSIMDNTSMNVALCGGDIVGLIGTVAQLTDQTESIVDYINYIGKDKFFIVRGNHDFYNRTDVNDISTTTALSEGKAYDTLCRCGEFVEKDMIPAHMCYTVINEAQKTVFLMMNSKDAGGTVQSNISGEQAKWIADTLLKYKDCSIVAVSHIPADSALVGYDSAQDIIHTILAAFQAKGTISTTHDSVSIIADYSSATGKVICHLSGHAHTDEYHFADGILSIVTTCDAYYRDDGYDAEAGTITEHAIDVFCIDYDNTTINAVRVGRGYNRAWNYSTGNVIT